MAETFLDAVRLRRSNYDLTPEIPFSDEELSALLKEVAEKSPSPFNMQNPRLVLLLGEEHKKLWELVRETLRPIVNDEEKFKSTDAKIDGFAKGYGTILYFTNEESLKKAQEAVPSFADNFPQWADHANGAVLYAIWTALASIGIGASIQHYNPLIDEDVRKMYDIPEHWTLVGQMPFGVPASRPEPRPTVSDMLTVRK